MTASHFVLASDASWGLSGLACWACMHARLAVACTCTNRTRPCTHDSSSCSPTTTLNTLSPLTSRKLFVITCRPHHTQHDPAHLLISHSRLPAAPLACKAWTWGVSAGVRCQGEHRDARAGWESTTRKSTHTTRTHTHAQSKGRTQLRGACAINHTRDAGDPTSRHTPSAPTHQRRAPPTRQPGPSKRTLSSMFGPTKGHRQAQRHATQPDTSQPDDDDKSVHTEE